jgi:LmbE family N-acetylglucosaminyl deacetylase
MTCVVFFHAHPDDEALLTGGTMARLAAEGHRIVLVTATNGEAGLAPGAYRDDGQLGVRRRSELDEAARALGCARVVVLDYADSGMADARTHAERSFADADVDEAARRLLAVIEDEGAEVLTGYDAAGGYGHPDHRQVHRVARRAAEMGRVPVLLEATVDRRALQRAVRMLRSTPLRRRLPDLDPAGLDAMFTAPDELTHRVDVRPFVAQKAAALRAHLSQAVPVEDTVRTVGGLLRLPRPLFTLALGREWFTEVGREPGRRLLDDPLASLR